MCAWKNQVSLYSVVLIYYVNYLFGGIYMTRVLAQVEAKMVKPQPERPFEGSITIHSEISPMASSDYEPGR